MGLKLYMSQASPPVRSVLLTARALKLPLEHHVVNLMEKEQLKPEYLKLNPQHTVPILQDDDFVIWDSHAINAYLVNKYAKDDSLYPKDPRKRAFVDQRLHFDSGTVFPCLISVCRPVLFHGVKEVPQDKTEAIQEAYKILETLLASNKWVAGDFLSIADFCLVCTITSLNIFTPVKEKVYPNITAWIKRCEELPYYDANKEGLGDLSELVSSKLKA